MARPLPPPPKTKLRVRALVDEHGVRRTARALDVSDTTIARLAGGLPVQSTTAEAVAARLELLGAPEAPT